MIERYPLEKAGGACARMLRGNNLVAETGANKMDTARGDFKPIAVGTAKR